MGGQGAKPAAGCHVGAAGLTADIALAIDVRGPQGDITVALEALRDQVVASATAGRAADAAGLSAQAAGQSAQAADAAADAAADSARRQRAPRRVRQPTAPRRHRTKRERGRAGCHGRGPG
ncbi:hypothetical protein ACU4GD_28215 [Cupriavidus basilensis]